MRDSTGWCFFDMVRMGTAAVLALACGLASRASADVVTNRWITPKGGYWLETGEDGTLSNWAGGLTEPEDVLHTVADFPLAPGGSVRFSSNQVVVADGLLFHPVDDSAGDASDPASWPSWYLLVGADMKGIAFCPHLLGYFPLRVQDGWLVIGEKLEVVSGSPNGVATWGPVRKEGNGYARISSFYRKKDSERVLEIEDGKVFSMQTYSLAYADVRVTKPAGELVLTNYSPRTMIGALTPQPGVPVPLMGNELQMGQMSPAVLPGEVCGTGRVTAIVRTLSVTNVQPGIVYGARAGRLRLDSTTSAARPFACYDFEESLVADSSGNGRTLAQEGAVARVYDAERGGYVARFTAAADAGGRLVARVPGVRELTGNADYTVSFWAKAALPCANAFPSLFSLGTSTTDHSLVQFRFQDSSCTNLLFGHWNGVGDFTNIQPTVDPADWNPAAWHHYVAMREGNIYSLWLDGRRIFYRTDVGLTLTLGEPVQIGLGCLATHPDRCFNGDMDDVRIYPCAVGAVGAQCLFVGREPPANDGNPSTGEALSIPEGTKLALGFNGEIQLAGDPTFAATNIEVASSRGTLAMPAGGSLTLTGPGAFNGDVTGANAVVKDGPERLVFGGSLRHTGGTEVKEGTLALQHPATLPPCFAAYDFEVGLGVDSACGGYDLTTQVGVARVYDAERGGYVARFPGTAEQKLERAVTDQLLTGDADYTISLWAKPDADGNAMGTFLSVGVQSDFGEIVFRYKDLSSGMLVLSHWGGALDFGEVPGLVAPQGAWHHYVAMKRGATYTVFCDGVQTWQTTNEQPLKLGAWKNICLGQQIGNSTRSFKGLLDDVRIYACALDADQLAALHRRADPSAVARGAAPDALAAVPAPILHYAFETPGQPGFDSAPGAHHLTKVGDGTLTLVDSPLGGKALQFDKYNVAYLRGEGLHTALPRGGEPFTVSAWIMTANTDTTRWVGPDGAKANHAPSFICWGDPVKKTIIYMFSYLYDGGIHGISTFRGYFRNSNGSAFDANFGDGDWLIGLREGEDAFRWHHYATVYDPAVGAKFYVDGECIEGLSSQKFVTDGPDEGCVFYLGSKSTALDAYFRGALDEVKVFGAALDLRQIRAVMRADAGALRILPEGDSVTIAAGATLEVSGTQETFGSLAGEGTFDLASGHVTLTNGASSFAGTLMGSGLLRLAAGATLSLEKSPTPFTGVFDMAGGEIMLPEASAPLAATFRTTVLDGARQVAYPGGVEIPDGTAIALSQTVPGPLVSANGPVTICGGGTVTLPNPKARGTWVLAHGNSFIDLGTTDLATRWKVANLEGSVTPRFTLTPSGDFVCRVESGGTLLLLR
ncbi:MAG: LamG-like jellyroll fold domain-containing protein [Kiritimatiellia bacterium]